MSPLETLGFALGTSFASGLNLYATVAAAGLSLFHYMMSAQSGVTGVSDQGASG